MLNFFLVTLTFSQNCNSEFISCKKEKRLNFEILTHLESVYNSNDFFKSQSDFLNRNLTFKIANLTFLNRKSDFFKSNLIF